MSEDEKAARKKKEEEKLKEDRQKGLETLAADLDDIADKLNDPEAIRKFEEQTNQKEKAEEEKKAKDKEEILFKDVNVNNTWRIKSG